MDIQQLQKTMIFHNMSEYEIADALSALQAIEKKYKKGAIIFHAGMTTVRAGLVLEGSVTIERNDMWGNRTILSHIGNGHCFAETYALLDDEPMLVDVSANEASRILFLKINTLAKDVPRMKAWQVKFIANLLIISSHKNLALSGRSFHTSPKTVRARIMAYLHTVALQQNKREFDIPFDRQQLADYLNLDRSALSKELGKMRVEGIVDFHKNHFKVIAKDALY
ncbi:MAG: Crp/Fnr family transcriptional regulator [Treponema sp.]|nr:Crp/Fnr family transcriptional regulator [Treponema sp.]